MKTTSIAALLLVVGCSSSYEADNLIGDETAVGESGGKKGGASAKGGQAEAGAASSEEDEPTDTSSADAGGETPTDEDGGVVPKEEAGAPVPPSGCLSAANVVKVSGAFTSQYSGQPADNSTIDARGASWTMKDGWLSTPKSSSNVCWVGGEFSLSVDDTSISPTAAWADIWHHNGGQTLKYNNTNWTFDSITVRHVGDAFNMSDGAQNFTIRHSHIVDVRDDCVQNDDFHAGDVHHNFFEGCYAGFSARATAGVTPNDGHNNLWSIHDNIVWIKPSRSVYKGDSPGNAQLIKWEKTNPQLAPKLAFKNNMVRIGKTPFQSGSSSGESFYFPPGIDFAGNTLYWDGGGTAPASLVAMFDAAHGSKIVYTSAEWDAAVAAWKSSHPDVK